MSIRNIKLTVDKTSVKAGDTVLFTISWDGDPNYIKDGVTYWGDKCNIEGRSGFEDFGILRNVNSTQSSVKFYHTIPKSWAGSKKGMFYIDHFDPTANITTSTGTSSAITLNVTALPIEFTVVVDPSAVTVAPGDEVPMRATAVGAPQPYTSVTEWYIDNNLVFTGDVYMAKFKKLGQTESIRARMIVTPATGSPVVKSGTATITSVIGSMDNVVVMISSNSPSVTIGQEIRFNANVSGAPAGSTIKYQWKMNGVPVENGDTSELKYLPTEVSTPWVRYNASVTVTVTSQNYSGLVVESPLITVAVLKEANPVIIYEVNSVSNVPTWGDFTPTWELIAKVEHPLNPGTYVRLLPVNDVHPEFKVDGITEISHRPYQGNEVIKGSYSRKPPSWFLAGTTHTASFKSPSRENEFFEAQELEHTFEFTTVKYPWMPQNYFVINGNRIGNNAQLDITAAPGDTINIPIQVLMHRLDSYTPGDVYSDDLEAMSKEGVFSAKDALSGNPVGEFVDGVFTVTLPEALYRWRGIITWELSRPDLYSYDPISTYINLNVDIVSNPLSPKPEMNIVQDPLPVRLDDELILSKAWVNLPTTADQNESYWSIDGVDFGAGDSALTSAKRDMVVKNTTIVKNPGNDPATITKEYNVDIILKQWPSISLELMPARTTIPWGEFLIVGYDVVGEEAMDQTGLVIGLPEWYIDGVKIQSVAGDGSLAFPATNPGPHVVTGKVRLDHPDYENTTLIVEKSFNIITEPRNMAITLDLTPKNATVGIGKSQKFTVAVAGVPEGGASTYVWEVDAAVQSSTTNNMDYIATTEGTKVIKVTVTTKADGAEDDVQSATTNLTVNKNVMAVTAVASTTTPSIKVGDNYTIKCDVTGQPTGATIAYKWDSGETTQSVTKASTTVGPISRKCTVTVKHADYIDSVVESNTVTIQVDKKVQTTTATASTATPIIKVDELYEAGVSVTGAPSGAIITYLWNTGETTQNISKLATVAETIKLRCIVTVTHADYEDKVITTNEVSVVVEDNTPVIPDDCPILYVHPLPHRGSAYIWAGWWVMDAIEKLSWEGKDWKTATAADTPYYCHLAVLAKMLVDYPEVDVQESRNGRIIHRSALEVGIIY